MALALVLALLLALSACGRGEDGGQSGDSGAAGGSGDTGEAGGTGGEDGSGAGDPGAPYTEGGLGEAMHTYWFDFTVESARICQSFGGYSPAENSRLVAVELSVTSTCEFPVDMGRTDFQLEWDTPAGPVYAYPLSAQSMKDKTLLPDAYTLGGGKSRSGVLVYEVPVADSLEYYLAFAETFDDGEEGRRGDAFVVRFTAAAETAGEGTA